MFRQTLQPSPSNVNPSPGLDMKINDDGLESFINNDEEVIGIITMEDVLEQLLQVNFMTNIINPGIFLRKFIYPHVW